MIPNEQNKNKSSIDKLFEQSDSSKVYRKGQYIYREDEQARGIFRVQKGRVKIWKLGSSFTRSLILYFVHASESFGIIDFFKEGKKRRCSATAMDNEVIVQFIPLSKVERFLYRDAEFRQEVIQLLVQFEQTTFEKYVELQMNLIDEKVYRALQTLAKVKGKRTEAGIILETIIHQDLSDYIGISRQSVTNSINILKALGLIEYNRKIILVKNTKPKS